MATITSANAVFILTVPGIYPQGVQLQGFSAEKAWSSDAQEMTESQMGVDGIKASGYVPAMVPQTVSLLANSASRQVFNNIANAQKANKDAIVFQGSITLAATGESFSCINGTVKNAKSIPDALKVLGPVDIQLEWQDILPTLL
jgi:hypothetical protein